MEGPAIDPQDERKKSPVRKNSRKIASKRSSGKGSDQIHGFHQESDQRYNGQRSHGRQEKIDSYGQRDGSEEHQPVETP